MKAYDVLIKNYENTIMFLESEIKSENKSNCTKIIEGKTRSNNKIVTTPRPNVYPAKQKKIEQNENKKDSLAA